MNRFATLGIIGLAAALSAAKAAAQDISSYTRAQIDSIVNPPVMKGGDALLRFDAPLLRIGMLVDTDSARTYRFAFTNVSDQSLRISRVSTNCGCTEARFTSEGIAPGQSGQVSLTYHPEGRPGTIDTQAFVYLEGRGTSPVARLTLLGEVKQTDRWDYLPHTAGALRLKRLKLHFAELPAKGHPSMHLLCANTGHQPLRLSALMLPTYATFRCEPTVIAPGREADIVITLDAAQVPPSAKSFSVLIDGVECRPSQRTLEVTIDRLLQK